MTNAKKITPAEVIVEKSEEISKEIVAQPSAVVKTEEEIDTYLATRKAFIEKVNSICVEGRDYHIIQGKKSLAKGGAEKIASIFKWTAKFEKDTDSLSMLGDIKGLVAYKCTLMNGQFVGEGRGAAMLAKNAGDPNKTLKMAQKSAFIDAVLRGSGLSDFYTQDLEDMDAKDIGQTQNTTTVAPSEKQLALIDSLMQQKGITPERMYDEGFDLKNLTGGKEGTASEAINFLFKFSSYSNGLTPLSDSEKAKSMFIKDLEEAQTIETYNKVSSDITLAKNNGKLDPIDYSIVLKVAKITVKRIEDSLKGLQKDI